MTVKELLSGPEKWTQGYYAKNEKDGFVASASHQACKWCLLGAINKCYGFDGDQREVALAKLRKVLARETNTIAPVDFNDSPQTTFKDVRRVVELADI